MPVVGRQLVGRFVGGFFFCSLHTLRRSRDFEGVFWTWHLTYIFWWYIYKCCVDKLSVVYNWHFCFGPHWFGWWRLGSTLARAWIYLLEKGELLCVILGVKWQFCSGNWVCFGFTTVFCVSLLLSLSLSVNLCRLLLYSCVVCSFCIYRFCSLSLLSFYLWMIPGHCEHPLRFCKKVVIVLRTWVHHRIVARQYWTMCSREGGTHNVWCTGSVCVRGRVGVASAFAVARTRQLWRFGGVPFVNDEIDGHFALETGDVPMAEVVAQFVDLRSVFILKWSNFVDFFFSDQINKSGDGISSEISVISKRRQQNGKERKKTYVGVFLFLF